MVGKSNRSTTPNARRSAESSSLGISTANSALDRVWDRRRRASFLVVCRRAVADIRMHACGLVRVDGIPNRYRPYRPEAPARDESGLPSLAHWRCGLVGMACPSISVFSPCGTGNALRGGSLWRSVFRVTTTPVRLPQDPSLLRENAIPHVPASFPGAADLLVALVTIAKSSVDSAPLQTHRRARARAAVQPRGRRVRKDPTCRSVSGGRPRTADSRTLASGDREVAPLRTALSLKQREVRQAERLPAPLAQRAPAKRGGIPCSRCRRQWWPWR